ncbi:hypothetical protein DdX_20985 [Ditylenchus destructor]|uniref:Uncharacterized protein n=1 Tax=Ditylenchus destructor TaxID=166010 RepID=A0AAD4QTB0_9BILA|nr:hypothetical protein DdX_20985 [Ditylenchus destructor]
MDSLMDSRTPADRLTLIEADLESQVNCLYLQLGCALKSLSDVRNVLKEALMPTSDIKAISKRTEVLMPNLPISVPSKPDTMKLDIPKLLEGCETETDLYIGFCHLDNDELTSLTQ